MDTLGNNILQVGDRIHCKNARDLRRWALQLSSEGYGIAIFGYHDIYEHILTVTALPEEEE